MLTLNEGERVRLMTRNALQVLRIVQATFSDTAFDGVVDSARCAEPASDAKQLQCEWGAVKALQFNHTTTAEENLYMLTKVCQNRGSNFLLLIPQFLRTAQEIMSSAASNYDVLKLQLGIMMAAMAACCAVAALAVMNLGGESLWTGILMLSYGAVMFASSYVEEEQQFWYWINSGWLTILFLKLLVESCSIESKSIADARYLVRSQAQSPPRHRCGVFQSCLSFIELCIDGTKLDRSMPVSQILLRCSYLLTTSCCG